MTQEQAEALRDTYNTTLTNAGINDQTWYAQENFSQNYQSNWDTVLVPDVYAAKYGTATAAQLAGFGRVYQDSFTGTGPGATYITNFNTNAANDSVLGPYLGL